MKIMSVSMSRLVRPLVLIVERQDTNFLADLWANKEDTYILLDALEADAEELREAKPRICLEIGSGSGCVSTFAAKILGPSECLHLCTDINKYAARCTHLTGRQNNVTLDPVLSSRSDAFDQRFRKCGGVDLLIFNPPYVPTADEEAINAQDGANIAGAWAGGKLGMEITNQVLTNVKDILSRSGRLYLVAVKWNDVPSIQKRMAIEQGLESKVVLERRAGREYLYVLKFFRHCPRSSDPD